LLVESTLVIWQEGVTEVTNSGLVDAWSTKHEIKQWPVNIMKTHHYKIDTADIPTMSPHKYALDVWYTCTHMHAHTFTHTKLKTPQESYNITCDRKVRVHLMIVL